MPWTVWADLYTLGSPGVDKNDALMTDEALMIWSDNNIDDLIDSYCHGYLINYWIPSAMIT